MAGLHCVDAACSSLKHGAAAGLVAVCVSGMAARAELPAPVAAEASGVSPSGFTANWAAAAGATGYALDVYRYDGVPPTVVREGFDAYPAVVPQGWSITNSGGAYTSAGGYGASAPSVKLEADGHAVMTPVFPAPATNFAFWCRGYSVSNSYLSVEAYDGSAWRALETVAVSGTACVKAYRLDKSAGYTRFRLVYDKDAGNVGVDDLESAYGDAEKSFVASNQAVGNVVSWAVTNLVPGAYRYVVRATSGSACSADSNEITVDTAAVPGPPRIAPLAPRVVRVGEEVSFALPLTATEGHPVTATNVTASAGTAGVWSLAAGLFRYAPAAADAGERWFAFTAADQDGACDAVAVTVTVRRAQVPAVRMTAASGAYSQGFHALAANGLENVWDNLADPLEAWSAYAGAQEAVSYRAGSGTGTVGGLYAFGAAGSADRSLGSLASAENVYRYGVAFTNETGLAVTNLAVSFTAEQWRVGASATTNALVFEYGVTNQALPLTQGVWWRVRSLCFRTPLVTNGSVAAGAAYASSVMSAVLPRPVAAGAVVRLRWSDADDAGNDHALGIDDVAVTWAAGAMPEAIPVGRAGAEETFDELGPDSAGALPFLWRVEVRSDAPRVSGPYADAASGVMYRNAVSNFTAAGSYGFASGAEGDYAVGGLSSADGAKSVTVSAKFLNATGVPVRRWRVRYAAEKYRAGPTGCQVAPLASRDGSAWARAGEPAAFEGDAGVYGFAPEAAPGRALPAEALADFGAAVQPGGVFYLAWQYAVSEGEPDAGAQALGVDEVRVEPVFSGGCVLTLK